MKKTISLLLLCWLYFSATAQNNYFELYTDSAILKKQNDELISDMETRIKLLEPSFSFNGLTTETPNVFMQGQFRYNTNKIYHIIWPTGEPVMQGFLTEVTGSPEDGKKMAALVFYGFFFPHEIGHALQFHTNNVPKNDYDGEYEANEIAVLYWRAKGKNTELQQCYEMAKKALKKLKNPVPENTDAQQYINEHYNELVQDPYKYGYIQFSQIVKIMEDKSLPEFDVYIKKYFVPKPTN